MARKVGFVSEDDHREHERNRRDKDRGTAPKVVVCPPSRATRVAGEKSDTAKGSATGGRMSLALCARLSGPYPSGGALQLSDLRAIALCFSFAHPSNLWLPVCAKEKRPLVKVA